VRIVTTIDEWRNAAESARRAGKTVGLVPTMGALHAGHESLIRAARARCDVVVVSIFVNPRQFSNEADLATYPRSPQRDHLVAEAAGADLVVEPELAQIWPDYPAPTATSVVVSGLADAFEGADRPGHFAGVASIVAKLLIVTGPCTAYFGEKDYQQLCVIQRMIRDLSFDVSVVGCPIIRDEDGVALSSRNVRLSSEGRVRARGLSRALASLANAETWNADEIRERLRIQLHDSGIDVAYADVVDPISLRPLGPSDEGAGRVLVAGYVDGVRLIDNAPIRLRAKEKVCS